IHGLHCSGVYPQARSIPVTGAGLPHLRCLKEKRNTKAQNKKARNKRISFGFSWFRDFVFFLFFLCVYFGKLARFSNKCAREAMSLRKSPSCRLSLGAWALLSGSSMPKRRAGAPPKSSARGPTKPMLPPQPMGTGSRL